MKRAEALLEGYMTRAELAKELGRLVKPDGSPLSNRTIHNYENATPGLPFTEVGRAHIYKISVTFNWLDARQRQKNVRAK